MFFAEDTLVAVRLGYEHLKVAQGPCFCGKVLQKRHELLEAEGEELFCEFFDDCDEEKDHEFWVISLVGDVGVEESDSDVRREETEQHSGDVPERQREEIDLFLFEVLIQLLIDLAQQFLDLRVRLPQPIESLGVIAGH